MSNVMDSFEDFKKNLGVVDTNMQIHAGPKLKESVTIALSWLNYAERGDADQERAAFIFHEYLPSVLRSVLNRRFNFDHPADSVELIDFLRVVAKILARHPGENEAMNRAVEDLLFPYQPFYLRIAGFEKPPPIVSLETTCDQSFVDGLEPQNYIDVLNKDNQWETAVIERFSEFHTEVEVTLNSNDEKIWLSLQDLHRFAPFGTKAIEGQNGSNTTTAAAAVSFAPPQFPLHEPPIVGDIIDARTQHGHWFQACVMEIKMEEVEIQITSSEMDVVEEIDNEKLKDDLDAEGEVSTSAEAVPMEQAEPAIDMSDANFQAKGDHDSGVVQAISGVVQAIPIEESTTTERIQVPVYRIAYIGFPDTSDEWIPFNSNRLAKLNSASNHRRGEFTVRDEVLHRSWRLPLPGTQRFTHFANFPNSFTSIHFAQLMSVFFNEEGFSNISMMVEAFVNSSGQAEVSKLFPLIRAVSGLNRIFTKQMYDLFCIPFFRFVGKVFANLNRETVRHVSPEDLDQTLTAFEELYYSCAGHDNEGGKVEILRLDLTWRFLDCPSLSRRMGGMKILYDFLRRAHDRQLYNGDCIRRVETVPDRIMYIYHRITYRYTVSTILKGMMDRDILDKLFFGSDAHEALIERSGEFLAGLAQEDMLTNEVIAKLVEFGFERQPSILRVLPDMIRGLDHTRTMYLIHLIRSIPSPSISEALLDVIQAIGNKYRDRIMQCQEPATLALQWHEGHELVITTFWEWVQDTSNLVDNVAIACDAKLQSLMEIGVIIQKISEMKYFYYEMQWIRVSSLIEKALMSIQSGNCLVPVAKLLTTFIFSWPVISRESKNSSNGEQQLQLAPFTPTRSGVCEYLVEKYNMYDLIRNALVDLKERFNRQVLSSIDGSVTGEGTTKPEGSRYTYGNHLNLLFELIYLHFRSMDKRHFPHETIERLWLEYVIKANFPDEFDSMHGFLMKIPSKFVDSVSATNVSNDVDTSSMMNASFFMNNRDEYIMTFKNCLCDCQQATGYFTNVFFNLKTFRCVERWFRWINKELGFTVEGKDGKIAKVSVDPAEMIGIDAFIRICFEAVDEKIAGFAVSFLTLLTRTAKKATQFRLDLMKRCIDTLTITDETSNAMTKRMVKRSLLLLDGLIDESFMLSTIQLHPHSSLFQGNLATFKVSGTSKNIKSFHKEIVLRLNDTIEDLFQAVAKEMKMKPTDIKMFRSGKEITLTDAKRTISQLPMFAGEKSSLVVAEKPNKATTGTQSTMTAAATCMTSAEAAAAVAMIAAATATVAAHNNAQQQQQQQQQLEEVETEINVSMETSNDPQLEEGISLSETEQVQAEPIALTISTTPELFSILFDLLRKSDSELIEAVWRTVVQLPTALHILSAWYELNCEDLMEFLPFSLTLSNINELSMLIYHLQIVELFLYPVLSFDKLFFQYGDKILNQELQVDAVAWCNKFISKGGLQFLCDCFQFITSILSSTANQQQQVPGVSVPLVLLAARISVKLLKGFQARGLLLQESLHPCTQFFVKDFLSKYHKSTSSTTNKTTSSSEVGEVVVPAAITEVSLREKLSQLDGGIAMDDLSIVNVNPAMLISTNVIYWSCITRFFAVCQLEINNSLDMNSSEAAMNSVLKVNPKPLESQEKRLLSCALQDLLFLWTSVALQTPNVLESTSFDDFGINFEGLFKMALLSDRNNTKANVIDLLEPYSLESLLGVVDWFPVAFMQFVFWIQHLDTAKVMLLSSLKILLDIRPQINLTAVTAGGSGEHAHYFSLLTQLLNTVKKFAQFQEVIEYLALSAISIVDEVKTLFVSISSHNQSSVDICDLIGNMRLLSSILTNHEQVLITIFDEETISFFLQNILGLVDIADIMQSQVLITSDARKSIYGVLTTVCQKNPKLAKFLFDKVSFVHHNLSMMTQDNKSHHEKSNQDWEIVPERASKSSYGFVGLRNLGSTCYMNSLLQVMFANEKIRYFMLEVLNCDVYGEESELKENILFQLQKVFLHLQHSEKKSFSPQNWTFAFKDETGVLPLNVMQQQDAQEFLQQLFERFERAYQHHLQRLENVENNSTYPKVDILNLTFGGKYCNQMYVAPRPHETLEAVIKAHGMRESSESFICISLGLESTLEESLLQATKGEMISDYQFTDNQPKVNIIKKQCLWELSDHIIFHLKRFELDYTTFMRQKINDRCAFPLRLNMKPFMREGQSESQYVTDTDEIQVEKGQQYYEFELTGVVIHSGTAESGHYYSFLKDTGYFSTTPQEAPTDAQWFEFNDAEVTPFHIDTKLESECFGGGSGERVYDLNLTTKVETVESTTSSVKNAYMLVYTRVTKLQPTTMTLVASTSSTTREEKSNLVEKMKAELTQENAQHRLACRVLIKDHFCFYQTIIRILLNLQRQKLDLSAAPEQQDKVEFLPQQEQAKIVREILRFYLACMLRTPHSIECVGLGMDLVQWFDNQTLLLNANSNQQNESLASTLSLESASSLVGTSVHEPLPDLPTATIIMPPLPPPIEGKKKKSPTDWDLIDKSASKLKDKPRGVTEEILEKNYLPAISEEMAEGDKHDEEPDFEVIVIDDDDDEVDTQQLSRVPTLIDSSFAPAASMSTVVSIQALQSLLSDFDTLILPNLIYAPNIQYRDITATLLTSILTNAWEHEYKVVTDVFLSGSIRSLSVLDTLPMTSEGGGSTAMDIDSNDDPELALAIKLSQEQSAASVSNVATTTQDNASRVFVTYQDFPMSATLGLAIELTQDHNLQLLAENWRRGGSYLNLLHKLLLVGGVSSAKMLVKRDLIAQLLDMFLGDASPLSGRIYDRNSRKRTPSSFVAFGFYKNASLIPHNLRSLALPDWTLLLDTVVKMTQYCLLTFEAREYYNNRSRLVLSYLRSNDVLMSEYDYSCLTCKGLYTTMIKQVRYRSHFIALVRRLAVDNHTFNMMMSEVLWEELTVATIDSMVTIFEVMEGLLTIADEMQQQRAYSLMGRGKGSLMEYMSNVVMGIVPGHGNSNNNMIQMSQTMQKQLIPNITQLAFVRSFVTLLQRVPVVLNVVANPIENVSHWAKWMIPVCRCWSSVQQMAATTGMTSGPYVVVYGEEEEYRETAWASRAERTYLLLASQLFDWGVDPEIFYTPPTIAPLANGNPTGATSVGTGNGSHHHHHPPTGLQSPGPPPLVPVTSNRVQQLSDGMTDEELARFLEGQPDDYDLD